MTPHDPSAAPPTPAALFLAFGKVGVLGFGGVAPLARHVLVEERRWMSERDFAEAFALASTLPGANTVNMSAMLGDRWCGFPGAVAASAGLLGAPLVILAAAAAAYAHFSQNSDVRAALGGAAGAAAGLVGGTAIRLLRGLDPDVAAVFVAFTVCLASAALRLPMQLILVVAVPISVAAVILRLRRSESA